MLDALKKALAERMLNAEMDQHLGTESADGRPNTRNGYGQKTVLTDTGRLALDIPRDRQGTFDPQLIAKYQRRQPKVTQLQPFERYLREGLDVVPELTGRRLHCELAAMGYHGGYTAVTCCATIKVRAVLPHPGMLPSRYPIASPECSRSTVGLPDASTL